jgi:glycine/serine hydroxymethyltransferase
MAEAEMAEIAELVHMMLTRIADEQVRNEVRRRSHELCLRFPLPYRDV